MFLKYLQIYIIFTFNYINMAEVNNIISIQVEHKETVVLHQIIIMVY